MYNQYRFEKELDASLTESNNHKDDVDKEQTLNLYEGDELALNNSVLLSQSHPADAKLKFTEVYSFSTIKELYQEVKVLKITANSKEARLNQHQQLLNNL